MESKHRLQPDDEEAVKAGGAAKAGRKIEDMPAAAQRALREAEERRARNAAEADKAREIGGRGGKDPARYGDWEVKGIAVDF